MIWTLIAGFAAVVVILILGLEEVVDELRKLNRGLDSIVACLPESPRQEPAEPTDLER